MKAFILSLAGLGLVGLSAYGQTINSAIIQPRVWNDIPGATLVTVSNYPTAISFTETGVSQATGFANRDWWRFSADGGSTAAGFNTNSYFQVSMTLSLTGTPATPRKEAGWVVSSSIGGDGQFIVNTDAHEVVAFGGALPFYAFPATFDSGETITLGMTYFQQENGKNAIIYTANGVNSPALEFTNLELGVINGSTLGGYFQIVNDPANALNSGSATFANITFAAIPEPSSMALLGLGLAAMLWRRRS